MQVVAYSMGFYKGERRRPGDVFEVPDGLKSKWFAPVGEKLEGFKAPVLPGPAVAPKAPAGEQAKGKKAPKAPAGEQAPSDEGRASDQGLI